jgi:exopolysaccharide production protein ExoY
MSDRTVTSRSACFVAPAAFELPSKRSPRRRGDAAGRAFDFALAVLLIAFTLPLLVAITLAVRLQGDGSVICAHQRVGRGGRLFRCLKYRVVSPDGAVTRVGDFLRQSGLDELPQLFNVLRGEMSIVGPRPITPAEVALYGHRLGLYCSIRPGITGLRPLVGRDVASYHRRVASDSVYAGKKSLMLDVKLLLRAIPTLIF